MTDEPLPRRANPCNHRRANHARRWEGLPGVTYPKPTSPRVLRSHDLRGQEEPPNRREWASTAEAAQILHTSTAAARIRLGKLRCPSIRAQGGLYWKRSTVSSLAEHRTYVTALPDGWVDTDEAMVLLRCGRSHLYRLEERKRLRTQKALLRGRERNLYKREDVVELRRLLDARDDIDRRINTNPA